MRRATGAPNALQSRVVEGDRHTTPRGTPAPSERTVDLGGAQAQLPPAAVETPVARAQSSRSAPPARADERFTPDQAAAALRRALDVSQERHELGVDDMSLEELVKLGREIGISADDVRVGAALERLGEAPDRGSWLERVAGPPVASESRVVSGSAQEVRDLIEEWVRVAYCMQLRDRRGDTARWEPAGGLAGAIRRGARSLVGEPVDDDLTGMTTRVAELDGNRTAVALEVEPGPRGRTVAAGIGAGVLVALLGLGLAGLTSPLALLAIPVGAGVAAATMIARRRRVAAAERAIARVMSGVAHGERPQTAIEMIRGRVGR